ncbi:quinon protein alcohol dehydrogenase-like superfamily [Trichoderma evansii]
MATHTPVSLSAGQNHGFQLGVNNGTIGSIIFNNSTEDDCLKELRLTDPRYDKQRIKDTKGGLLKGSYKWILDHPDYHQWRDNDQCRLLWIKGDPGKGKTMLLMGIVDELEQQPALLKQAEQSISHATVLSYFFCQGTDSNLKSATAVLRGLIFLLAVQQPSLTSRLREKYKESGPKLFDDINAFFALSEILSGMIQHPSLARAYIVIDALDECETDRQLLLKFVAENTCASRVKWIVSSRNWREIDEQLGSAAGKAKLCLELNEKSISAAVSTYIQHRVDQLALLKDYDIETKSAVQNHLALNANDTFLWVALVCQDLAKIAPWNTLDKLEEMAEAFPSGLDSLYQRMMKRIDNSDSARLCKRILAVVSVVYRPVTLEELPSLEKALEKIKPHYLSDIVESCGSLLTLRNGVIYFVHQSAKDYLKDKETKTIFPYGPTEAHHDIFLRSLVAMCKLRQDIYDLRHPGFSIDDLKVPVPDPLAPVRYSCAHWVNHLCDARNQGSGSKVIDYGEVFQFLKQHFLCWVEALSLIQQAPRSVNLIQSLQALLQRDCNKEQSDFLKDCLRILQANLSIIKIAPLQIYSSVLIFAPWKSIVRNHFKNVIPKWISLNPRTREHWDQCIQTLEGHNSSVYSVAFSPDSSQIASASGNRTVRLWRADTGECIQTLEGHSGLAGSVAFSPDSSLIASASFDKTIRLWRASTGECIQTLKGHSSSVRSVAFSPDLLQIASASDDKTVWLWRVNTGEYIRTLKGHSSSVRSVTFSPDSLLIASASDDKTVRLWHADLGKHKQTLNGHMGWVRSVAFSPDSSLIASASDDTTVRLWCAGIGECIRTLKGHSDTVQSVAFSPDSSLIASASDDKTIRLWIAATGECIQTLKGHRGWVRSVAFSPDSSLIASASDDKTIRLWRADVGEHKQTHEGHSDKVESVAFSLDLSQ